MSNESEDSDDLAVGKTFESTESAKEYMRLYNESNFTEYIVETNSSRCLVFSCKHSMYRESKSTGKRVQQHYNYLACGARIRMYKSQKADETGKVKITKVELAHNHPVTREIYENQHITLTDTEKELISTLKAANAKDSQIKRILLEKSQKKVTIQKLKNLLMKLNPNSSESTKGEFESFLVDLESDGGIVEWINDSDGKMKAMFFASSKMIAAFKAHNPPVIQTDTSFEFEKSRYKVAGFCYLDNNADCTGIGAFALMSEESGECFEFVLRQLKKMCCREDLIFLIDKDFTEMGSIKKVFPLSIILLCIFHCLKYKRTLFSTIPDVVERKNEVMVQFKRVLYSNTEEIFFEENSKFLELIEGLQVRRDKKYVSLKGYYEKNWLNCSNMWVKCYRKSLPLLGDNTTNRIENKFGCLKKSIKDRFSSLPDTYSVVVHLVKFANQLLEEKYAFGTNKRLRIFNAKEEIKKLNHDASYKLNERGCKVFFQTH